MAIVTFIVNPIAYIINNSTGHKKMYTPTECFVHAYNIVLLDIRNKHTHLIWKNVSDKICKLHLEVEQR